MPTKRRFHRVDNPIFVRQVIIKRLHKLGFSTRDIAAIFRSSQTQAVKDLHAETDESTLMACGVLDEFLAGEDTDPEI